MANLTIQFMTGETLPVCLEQEMTHRQFYRMVYAWLLPREIRPRYLWQMMLLRPEGWIRPNKQVFQPEEGEILYLLVDPRAYEIQFEYAYLAQTKWQEQIQEQGQWQQKEYDAIHFKIRDGPSEPWKIQIFYVTRGEPLAFYRQETVTVLGLSREFSMPRWFNWPYPVEERSIVPISQETRMYDRLDVLLDSVDLSVSARDHLAELIQEEWKKWVQEMNELGLEQEWREREQQEQQEREQHEPDNW